MYTWHFKFTLESRFNSKLTSPLGWRIHISNCSQPNLRLFSLKCSPPSPLHRLEITLFSRVKHLEAILEKKIYCSIVDLQCCANVCRAAKWLLYTYIDLIFKIFFPIMTYHRILNTVPHGPCCLSILNGTVCIPAVTLASSLSSSKAGPTAACPRAHLASPAAAPACGQSASFCPTSCHSLHTHASAWTLPPPTSSACPFSA